MVTPQRDVQLVKYDKIDLVVPERRGEFMADLKERTGLEITKVEIGAMDFLTDSVMLNVYYISQDRDINTVNKLLKMPKQNEIE